MEEKEVDEIFGLYNEARAEATSRSLPEYLVFAEKIIIREVDRAAKAVCFMCNEGNHPMHNDRGYWVHEFHRSSGFVYIEPCRAHVIRARKIPA